MRLVTCRDLIGKKIKNIFQDLFCVNIASMLTDIA